MHFAPVQTAAQGAGHGGIRLTQKQAHSLDTEARRGGRFVYTGKLIQIKVEHEFKAE